jgi:hypothetical protein
MADSLADFIGQVISQKNKFLGFVALLVVVLGLAVLVVYLVPKILHLNATQLTISSKGGEIELKASGPEQDQYYLVVCPQASWQPTHIYLKKGTKVNIVADGRVNVDFHGLFDQIENRIRFEARAEALHPGLKTDSSHTPEEYFSKTEWQQLSPRHYWSDPRGDFDITPTSYLGRQKYKIAPNLAYGALIGTIMSRADVDSSGQPPNEVKDMFFVGRRWPDSNKEEMISGTGWLWLAINDVVEPQDAFPLATKDVVPNLFLLDNLGFYRVVVSVAH